MRWMAPVMPLILLLAGTGAVQAQALWTDHTPANPPARDAHAMAYDSARGRVVMFGGYDGGVFGDTWEWDGNNWRRRTPLSSPAARSAPALAYDSARGRVVLFGGRDS